MPIPDPRVRIIATAAVAVTEAGHLLWEHTHGGILRHHLLDRADLPAFSNLWGIIVLPVLAWWLSGYVLRRAAIDPRTVLAAFAGAFGAAVLLSIGFLHGSADTAFHVLLGILATGLVLRIYRPEYVLGFVVGMSFTFGAILPLLPAAFIAAMSAIVHRVLRPVLVRATAFART